MRALRFTAAVSFAASLAGCADRAPRASAPRPAAPTLQSAPPPRAAAGAPSIDDVVASIRADAARSSGAFEIVKSLTEEVGPRLAGSAGDARAVAWAERTLAARGLSGVHSEPVTVPHWERGAESAELVVSGKPETLDVTALGGSEGTKAGGLDAEVVGAASLDDAEHLDPAAVRGKIVFIDTATERTRDGGGYGRAVKARVFASQKMAPLGAAAVIIRAIGTDTTTPHTGVMANGPIPAAALSGDSAAKVKAAIAAGKHPHIRLHLGARRLPDAQSANVIGEVRGRERPDEIVLLGAHLDSWDLGAGALDDGAGCAIVVEAARLVATRARAPRRTVRVVLYAAEENGVEGRNGGRTYTAAHETELARHVAAMEADAGDGRVFAARGSGAETAVARFDDVFRALAPLDVSHEAGRAHPGSDITSLLERGVPVIELAQDMTRYFDVHHTRNDRLDRIDAAALAQASTAFAITAYVAAEMDGDFGRAPEAPRKN